MNHPEGQHLSSFVARVSESDEQGLFTHLLSCRACARLALDLLDQQRRGLDWGNVLAFEPAVGGHLEALWHERFANAEAERRASTGRVEELLAETPERRRERLESEPELKVWAVAEQALEIAARRLVGDAAASLEAARLGLEVAGGLDRAFYGGRLVDDLVLRGGTLAAEAERRLGDREAAAAELERLAPVLERAVDPAGIALYDHVRALLARDQGRWTEAAALLQRAAAGYLELGDAPRAARPLASRGVLALIKGQPGVAAVLLRQALESLVGCDDQHTEEHVHHHLVLALVLERRFPEARRAWRRLVALTPAERTADPRHLWLKALLCQGTGAHTEARHLAERARTSTGELPEDLAERAAVLVLGDVV